MEEETIEEETEPEITVEEETSEEETKEDTEESKVSEEKKEISSFTREMHKAVCADCGKECEVPFKPTEGRPVYCRDCYRKHGSQRRRF
jgi:CxxC-x17-CxxC domain-containing protein